MIKPPRSLALAALLLGFSSVVSHAQTFTYDWSTASASSSGLLISGNDGWELVTGPVGDGSEDVVRSAGQPDTYFVGNYYQSTDISEPGNGDNIYRRTNDSNFSFSISPFATQITLSALVRHSGDLLSSTDGATLGIITGTSAVFSIGNGASGWYYRDVGDANSQSANGTGPATLDGTLRTWRITGVIDMTPAGSTKLFDLTIENLTDGGSEILFNDQPLYLDGFDDPSIWDGLFIRVNGITNAAYIDAITISFVPEVSTAVHGSLLGLFLIFACRWRSRKISARA